MPSLDQRRARYAWDCVQNSNDKYVNLAKSAPALIMNNGLMQTLAFYQGKGENHHKTLNSQICKWLQQCFAKQISGAEFSVVMESLHTTEDAGFYRHATEETLALLRWIRQFAPAVSNQGG